MGRQADLGTPPARLGPGARTGELRYSTPPARSSGRQSRSCRPHSSGVPARLTRSMPAPMAHCVSTACTFMSGEGIRLGDSTRRGLSAVFETLICGYLTPRRPRSVACLRARSCVADVEPSPERASGRLLPRSVSGGDSRTAGETGRGPTPRGRGGPARAAQLASASRPRPLLVCPS